MNYNDFTGEVQHRIEAATQGEAVRTIRAVLTTLGERLPEGEAEDLAAPLPMEIDWYLHNADSGQRFDWDEFVDRVTERASLEEPQAVFATQAVVALLHEIEPGGEIQDVRSNLPEEFDALFELVDADEQPWETDRE